jgi:hypothetical protein
LTLRFIPLAAATAALVICGLVHGFWTQRWGASEALEHAVARLEHVPLQAGSWTALNVEADPEPFRQARAAGWWMRRYTRQGGKNAVLVILMCGRAGQMSVHTPDVCYRGAGYEMAGTQEQKTLPGGAQYWFARFRPATPTAPELAIGWAWSSDGRWQAPDAPRLTFGGQPYLYKLYVVREAAASPGADPVIAAFLQEVLPVFDDTLFPRGLVP